MKSTFNLVAALGLAVLPLAALSSRANEDEDEDEGVFEQVDQAPDDLDPAVHTALGTFTGNAAEKYINTLEHLLPVVPQLFDDPDLELEAATLVAALALSERTQVLRIDGVTSYWDERSLSERSIYTVHTVASIAGNTDETFELTIIGLPGDDVCNKHPTVGKTYLVSMQPHDGSNWIGHYGQSLIEVVNADVHLKTRTVAVAVLVSANLGVQQ